MDGANALANKLPASDIFESIFGNIFLFNETNGVGALYLATNSIGKVSEFIGRGQHPFIMLVGMIPELATVEELVGGFIHDGECTVNFLVNAWHPFGEDWLQFWDTRGPLLMCALCQRSSKVGPGGHLERVLQAGAVAGTVMGLAGLRHLGLAM